MQTVVLTKQRRQEKNETEEINYNLLTSHRGGYTDTERPHQSQRGVRDRN